MVLARTETYIPLAQAAQKYGIPEKTLLDRVKSGSIAKAQLPNGDWLVAEHDVDPSLDIRRKDFEHLRGQKISASQASREYGVDNSTIGKWAKAGHITVLERGWKVMLDKADVAYCAAVYKAKQEIYGDSLRGVPIFDEKGNPYRV
ncbi:MAG: helix-turn-helix domain-containing protein, partial [Anaerolineae bacterium]